MTRNNQPGSQRKVSGECPTHFLLQAGHMSSESLRDQLTALPSCFLLLTFQSNITLLKSSLCWAYPGTWSAKLCCFQRRGTQLTRTHFYPTSLHGDQVPQLRNGSSFLPNVFPSQCNQFWVQPSSAWSSNDKAASHLFIFWHCETCSPGCMWPSFNI